MEGNDFRKSGSRRLIAAIALLAAGSWTSLYAQGLDPASVEEALRPGDSFDLSKTAITPVIPPRPDICFLADTTGSMGGAIINVRNNVAMIMNLVRAVQPDSQFCAAQYRDSGDSPEFRVDQAVTAVLADVQTSINGWVAGGGGDTPEGQLHALTTQHRGGLPVRLHANRLRAPERLADDRCGGQRHSRNQDNPRQGHHGAVRPLRGRDQSVGQPRAERGRKRQERAESGRILRAPRLGQCGRHIDPGLRQRQLLLLRSVQPE